MKTLAAALLLALSLPAHAGDRTGAAAQKKVDDLQQGIGNPEDFESFVEGSKALPDLRQDPKAAAMGTPTGPSQRQSFLNPASRGSSPDRAALPPVPLVAQDLHSRSRKPSENPLANQAGLLGLAGALLIAASFYQGAPKAATPTNAKPAPDFFREPEAYAPAPPPAALELPQEAPDAFVDTRMPAPTWRAISLREQTLIESWNASREKAQGLASLEDWIDARAGSIGIDAQALKSKLYRDA